MSIRQLDGQYTIRPPTLKNINNEHTYSASIVSNEPTRSLWYSFPSDLIPHVAKYQDCFVLGVLFEAMKTKQNIHVEGILSAGLIPNLEEFMVIWNSWLPTKYRPIKITCDQEVDAVGKKSSSSVLSFSGGLDSSFTLQRHAQSAIGKRSRSIELATMVRGFDIPLSDEVSFKKAFDGAFSITSAFDVPLFPISTNLREFQTTWEDCFFSMLTSVLSVFSGQVANGLCGNDDHYIDPYLPWGSNPITNHFLGSDNFRIYTDGAECDRLEKTLAIAGLSDITENLRVCWESPSLGSNCGRCEKCIRTILGFKAVGLPVPRCFPGHLTLREIAEVRIHNPVAIEHFSKVLLRARENGFEKTDWYRTLSRVVKDTWRSRLTRSAKSFWKF